MVNRSVFPYNPKYFFAYRQLAGHPLQITVLLIPSRRRIKTSEYSICLLKLQLLFNHFTDTAFDSEKILFGKFLTDIS